MKKKHEVGRVYDHLNNMHYFVFKFELCKLYSVKPYTCNIYIPRIYLYIYIPRISCKLGTVRDNEL